MTEILLSSFKLECPTVVNTAPTEGIPILVLVVSYNYRYNILFVPTPTKNALELRLKKWLRLFIRYNGDVWLPVKKNIFLWSKNCEKVRVHNLYRKRYAEVA